MPQSVYVARASTTSRDTFDPERVDAHRHRRRVSRSLTSAVLRRWQNIPVGRTDQPLLAQIDRDALDDRVPLATTLRKCIALGAQARNDELRDWASKELDGYRDGDIPSYRIIHVPLLIDGLTFTHQVRGQQISTMDLPDFARDVITEELPLAHGVGDLQALVRNARAAGKTAVKMAPDGAADLVKLWNHERQNSGDGTIMSCTGTLTLRVSRAC
jgi:hypothetical protein